MTEPPRSVPPTASVVAASDGDKLHAPAAARNADALCELLNAQAPKQGKALELASGTGQHVVVFASALPDLSWQPTDVEDARLRSIDAYVAEAGLHNVAPAQRLDATRDGWADDFGGQDFILLVNLLHLIPKTGARMLISEAARALSPGGRVMIYGPFMQNGELTSEGDRNFHASLTAHDPQIGYKDAANVLEWMSEAGLHPAEPFRMPANNLALMAERVART